MNQMVRPVWWSNRQFERLHTSPKLKQLDIVNQNGKAAGWQSDQLDWPVRSSSENIDYPRIQITQRTPITILTLPNLTEEVINQT